MNQQTALIFHLQHKPISQLVAAREMGIYRLSERIRELEFRGFQIDRRTAEQTNRYGNTTRYTVYSLVKCPANARLFKALFGFKKPCK